MNTHKYEYTYVCKYIAQQILTKITNFFFIDNSSC